MLGIRRFLVSLCLIWVAAGAWADDRVLRLSAPEALTETGLLKHILPRFSLKTQVRVELVSDRPDAILGTEGRAVFEGVGQVWHLQVLNPDHPASDRFSGWLTSQVGKNTVTGFAPDGTALFSLPSARQVVAVQVEADGDAVLGLQVSRDKCSRCHVVEDGKRGFGIGSTPSFGVLRSLPDWEGRFAGFYVLNPHPAFTIIPDVTPPFPDSRPSPIVPVTLNLDELEAILAYVTGMPAADLGGDLVHQ
ncbi:hypothetical protein ACMU_01315 [Actibacterium mucosum KCTC 23349]|uniref:Cytochrome c domain-containing protein n=1 Tax=Actibacterium mucosum KCTC 23349 TaxID=1454373 RepID=A0A037ZL35_9RHOB|nr:hypothetical protein [Actibacterium mucosum]KAJ57161.1 hypothetical protein ACMU_01315 [Actibacterium mucosum KCTC 23349]